MKKTNILTTTFSITRFILFLFVAISLSITTNSCKDYDDDIDGLRKELSDAKTSIEDVKKLVGSGKYVKEVKDTAEGIEIVFSDGTSKVVKNGKTPVVTIDKGVWVIDGKPTTIPASGKAPIINKETGMWQVWDEATNAYKDTEYSAKGAGMYVTPLPNNGGWTLHVEVDGKKEEIKLPKVPVNITSLVKPENLVANSIYWGTFSEDKEFNGIKYKKGVINSNGGIVPVIVNPNSIDASIFDFNYLSISTKKTLFTLGTPKAGWEKPVFSYSTKPASENGLWTLSLNIAGNAKIEDLRSYDKENAYAIGVTSPDKTTVSSSYGYKIIPTEVSATEAIDTKSNITATVGKKIDIHTALVEVSNIQKILNSTLKEADADKSKAKEYGVTIDNKDHTLIATNDKAIGNQITCTFEYITLAGKVDKKEITLRFVKSLEGSPVLDPVEVTLEKKDVYTKMISLANMFTALGDNKQTWVEKTKDDYEVIIKDKDGKVIPSEEIKIAGYYELDANNKAKVADKKKATHVMLTVDPTKTKVGTFSATLNFRLQTNELLNSATVSINIKNSSSKFEDYVNKTPAYFQNGVLKIYGAADGSKVSYDLLKAFTTKGEGTLTFDEAEVKGEDKWLTKENGSILADIKYVEAKRTYTAKYAIFGNKNNVITDKFEGVLASPVKDGKLIYNPDKNSASQPFTLKRDGEIDLTKTDHSKEYIFTSADGVKLDLFPAAPTSHLKTVTLDAVNDPNAAILDFSTTGKIKVKANAQINGTPIVKVRVNTEDNWGIKSAKTIEVKVTE